LAVIFFSAVDKNSENGYNTKRERYRQTVSWTHSYKEDNRVRAKNGGYFLLASKKATMSDAIAYTNSNTSFNLIGIPPFGVQLTACRSVGSALYTHINGNAAFCQILLMRMF